MEANKLLSLGANEMVVDEVVADDAVGGHATFIEVLQARARTQPTRRLQVRSRNRRSGRDLDLRPTRRPGQGPGRSPAVAWPAKASGSCCLSRLDWTTSAPSHGCLYAGVIAVPVYPPPSQPFARPDQRRRRGVRRARRPDDPGHLQFRTRRPSGAAAAGRPGPGCWSMTCRSKGLTSDRRRPSRRSGLPAIHARARPRPPRA